MVDGACHIGRQIRIAVGVAADERTDRGALRRFGHRGEECPTLKVGPVGIAKEREEVVPSPDGVDTKSIGTAPRFAQLGQRRVLRWELNTDFRVRHEVILSITMIEDITAPCSYAPWSGTTVPTIAISRRAARLR